MVKFADGGAEYDGAPAAPPPAPGATLPAGSGAGDASITGSESEEKDAEESRTYFPETWLWKMIVLR